MQGQAGLGLQQDTWEDAASFFYACLAKYVRFFLGETAQDGKTWQQ